MGNTYLKDRRIRQRSGSGSNGGRTWRSARSWVTGQDEDRKRANLQGSKATGCLADAVEPRILGFTCSSTVDHGSGTHGVSAAFLFEATLDVL